MRLAILGIGKYAEVIIELCEEIGHTVEALYHFNSSRNGEEVMGYKIQGDYDDFINLNNRNFSVVVAIGDNKTRNLWLNKLKNLGFSTISLIHPSAYISKSAQIGSGVYIHARSFVWSRSIICDNVIISPNAMVAHHVHIGQGCLISANSMVGSYVKLEEEVLIGINAGVISRTIVIGKNSVIGANSMVIRNVEEGSVITGTPGKKIN